MHSFAATLPKNRISKINTSLMGRGKKPGVNSESTALKTLSPQVKTKIL
jgi:hypothetical protein